jgi:hypothetical protein
VSLCVLLLNLLFSWRVALKIFTIILSPPCYQGTTDGSTAVGGTPVPAAYTSAPNVFGQDSLMPRERKPISDAAINKATGKSREQWFRLLDRKGAKKLAHKEIARMLSGAQVTAEARAAADRLLAAAG